MFDKSNHGSPRNRKTRERSDTKTTPKRSPVRISTKARFSVNNNNSPRSPQTVVKRNRESITRVLGENRYSQPKQSIYSSTTNAKVAEAELAYSIAQEVEEERGNMTSESGCTGLGNSKHKSGMNALTPIEESKLRTNEPTNMTNQTTTQRHTTDQNSK